MRFKLVSTHNVTRFFDAASALERRLTDTETMGIGLVYGKPGLGKTLAMDSYYARTKKAGKVRVGRLRAKGIWTCSSMLRAFLRALGVESAKRTASEIYDELAQAVDGEPAVFVIDEIDAIAGNGKLIATLKDIHDDLGCAILMVGEDKAEAMLRRFESFYNRFNRSARVHLSGHAESDTEAVVTQRCEVQVAPEACADIHKDVGGKSMRSVLDRIRDIEAFARVNGVKRVGKPEYARMKSGAPMVRAAVNEREEAINE